MAKNTPYKINLQKLKSTLLSIKARFESNTIHRMNDIANMYSTGLKKALGMGHDSFVTKFDEPHKFTVEDILKLSDITDVDKNIIWNKIVEEVEAKRTKYEINHILPDVEHEEQKK
ncbi:MAG: hypothetical protein LBF27_30890 [Sphingobacterium sp.]|jgi:hypothetical protein|nr:hypothetical protein [Sphingobacterium sp.]